MNNVTKKSRSGQEAPDLLSAAKSYLREGFSVFPVEAGTKRPAVIEGKRISWERFQDRKAAVEEIEKLFSRDGIDGIAVVCGKVSGGLIVLDFDGKDWAKGFDRFMRAFPRLEKTRKVITGSKRFHLWLRCSELPDDLTRKTRKFCDIDSMVELRANKHYILAPPSLHPSGRRYEFLGDDPILDLSRKELDEIVRWFDESKHRLQLQPKAEAEPAPERARKAAEYYLNRAITEAKPGNRNNTGFWLACQLRDLKLSEAEAEPYMIRYAQSVPEGDHPYTEDEALSSLRSAYRREPREPAIPGVRKARKYTPSGQAVVSVEINPKVVDMLIQHPASEAGNGETFRDLFGDRFCYVKEKGTWFWFDGIRWVEANEKANLAMLEVVRLRRKAAEMLENDNPLKDELEKWTRQCERYKIRRDQSLREAANYLHRSYTDFDTDPWLLCCANGVVDLRTGELRPAKPGDMLHKSTNIRFDPTAKCPRWERFLQEVFLRDEEMIDFIHRAIGYTLTGLMSDFLFICYGTGSNGKSVFLTVLEKLAGEYGISAPASTFKEKRGDMVPNDLARLAGARFCKSVEVREHIVLNEERVKALTGGDRISARFLHKEFFEFYPTAKVWWAVNHKPIIRDTTHAMWRRIKLIPFEARFEPSLGNWEPREKLLAELEAELPGILSWAVRGCLEWQERGLEPVERVKRATEEYRKESDLIERFLEECTISKPEASIKASELYSEFRRWAEINGELVISKQMFGRRMAEKGYRKVRKEKGVYYLGLGLIAMDEG